MVRHHLINGLCCRRNGAASDIEMIKIYMMQATINPADEVGEKRLPVDQMQLVELTEDELASTKKISDTVGK